MSHDDSVVALAGVEELGTRTVREVAASHGARVLAECPAPGSVETRN